MGSLREKTGRTLRTSSRIKSLPDKYELYSGTKCGTIIPVGVKPKYIIRKEFQL